MKIPVLSGVYTNETPDYRVAYPRNMQPIVQKAGISDGYLRPTEGIVELGDAPGIDRGGINWLGACYRVMGTKLVTAQADGTLTVLADVEGSGQVTFDYSFDLLGIASSGRLFFWDGTTLTENTDPDLGTVIDMLWIDGYWMVTDGETIAVTDLNDPYAVNPVKYGSSEADPDPINALLKLRNEVFAVNRNTIEVFDNIGGNFFPFQRIESAQIMRGGIGTFACAVFLEQIAFLGSGRNEAPAVWLGTNSQTSKISTREIDIVLSGYTETQLSDALVEVRVQADTQMLYIHLPDKTLVYDGAASVRAQDQVWFVLTSTIVGDGKYLARNFVWCDEIWNCGHPNEAVYGKLVDNISTHWNEVIGWDFSTQILWNDTKGALFHELELSGLPGRVPVGANPVIWTSYSLDGETFGQERPISAGKVGQTRKRLVWLQQGNMQNVRIQKFRGTSDAHLPFARLDAEVEPLYV